MTRFQATLAARVRRACRDAKGNGQGRAEVEIDGKLVTIDYQFDDSSTWYTFDLPDRGPTHFGRTRSMEHVVQALVLGDFTSIEVGRD